MKSSSAATDYSKWDKWAEEVESDDDAEAEREAKKKTRKFTRPNIGGDEHGDHGDNEVAVMMSVRAETEINSTFAFA